jgi:hypothetical protein
MSSNKDLPLMGQLTPAHVTFSPLLSTISLPRVLHGPWNAADVPLTACLRALYRNAALLDTSGSNPVDTTAPANADARRILNPSILKGSNNTPRNTPAHSPSFNHASKTEEEPQRSPAALLNPRIFLLIVLVSRRKIGGMPAEKPTCSKYRRHPTRMRARR